MSLRSFASFLLVAASTASAQPRELPDLERMTLEEIDALPEEVRGQMPMTQLMRRALELDSAGTRDVPPQSIELLIAYPLMELYYLAWNALTEADRREAVRAFQTKLGEDPTGELTYGQWETLYRMSIRRTDTPVYAGGLGTVYIYEGRAVAEGSWILEGEQIADPVNTSRIECLKQTQTCTVIQADISVPGLDDENDAYYLNLSTTRYEIISWTNDEVIARGLGGLIGTRCRTTLLTLNATSKEVYEITRNANEEGCSLDSLVSLPPLKAPRVARLVPGFKVTYDFWRDRKKETDAYVNPAFVEALKALLSSEPAR